MGNNSPHRSCLKFYRALGATTGAAWTQLAFLTTGQTKRFLLQALPLILFGGALAGITTTYAPNPLLRHSPLWAVAAFGILVLPVAAFLYAFTHTLVEMPTEQYQGTLHLCSSASGHYYESVERELILALGSCATILAVLLPSSFIHHDAATLEAE